jgi:voltage-gated potassium channel Kch
VLPDVKATGIQVAIGVTLLIVINTALSHWLSRRGTEWRSILQEFVVMTLVNFGLVLAAGLMLPRFDGSINLGNTLFLVLLLTLNVILYDRYHRVYVHRFEGG